MYKSFIEHYYPLVKTKALECIKNERDSLRNVFEVILEYAKKEKVIINDIKLVLNMAKYRETIELYSNYPEKFSNEIMIILCSKMRTKFSIKTILEKKSYMISYNTRCIAQVNLLDLSVNSVYNKVQHRCFKNVIIAPPVIEIMEMYRKLYNLEHTDEWEDTLRDIKTIECLVNSSRNELGFNTDPESAGCIGGGKVRILELNDVCNYTSNLSMFKPYESKKTTSTSNNNSWNDAKKLALSYLIEKGVLFCGTTGYYMEKKEPFDVIECIAEEDKEYVTKELGEMFKNSFKGAILESNTVYHNNPMNTMLKKEVFSLNIEGKCSPLFCMYNNTSYELINYTKKKHKGQEVFVASETVQLYFLYNNLWNKVIDYYLDKLTKKEFLTHANEFLVMYQYYFDKIDIYEKKSMYKGTYINKNIFIKMKAQLSIKKSYAYCNDFIR
jgi:hypothetical protein